tara:strand:+ start:265 stop:960 length:696 start_codon:yes stop_codon:yes gene_type:complete
MTYYYLILLLSISIPFLFSFHPRINFYKKFSTIFITIPLTAIPYIIWDILFVDLGIWGFNKEYVSNLNIYNLPIEEVLFFVIIPFCCIYTHHVIETLSISFLDRVNYRYINNSLILCLILVSIFYNSNFYTLVCFVSCAFLLILETYYIKIINYKYFYTTFILIMIPFVIVNGALTGMFDQMVVWYNSDHIIGLRLITIPIEDSIYALQLILFNLITYKFFVKNKFSFLKT